MERNELSDFSRKCSEMENSKETEERSNVD